MSSANAKGGASEKTWGQSVQKTFGENPFRRREKQKLSQKNFNLNEKKKN